MLDTIDPVFAALANATRRELLRLLRDGGAQPVQALAGHFPMQRPSISEHLKVLREVGLVSEQRQGRHRFYRLQAAPLQAIHSWLAAYEGFWQDHMARLETVLAEEFGDHHD